MSDQQSFSCFLIGADSLLVECGEILLARGHRVLGVISGAPKISDWARSKTIAVHDAKSDYRAALAKESFHYLFAITHLAIVPNDVLMLAERGAINFHDGPLPRYAGLNTPAWALMHREPTYGITWHFMNAGIDRGDVLKQRLFDVAPNETSLSINTKCFEVAIETFGELVDELATNTIAPHPQSAEGRQYFKKHARPAAMCLLDWNKSAVELEALVRALDFGRYPNPLGTPKLVANGHALAVTRAEARAFDDDASAGANEATSGSATPAALSALASSGAKTPRPEPGTVLSADDHGITVATGDGMLACLAFATVEGRTLTAREALDVAGIRDGERLAVLSTEESQRATSLGAELAKAEEFWIDRLATLEPVELPHASTSHSSPANAPVGSFDVALPPSLVQRFGTLNKPDAVFAAACAYVARVAHKWSFDVGYRSSLLGSHVRGLEPVVATRVPLRFRCEPKTSFTTLQAILGDELATLIQKKTFLRDLVARRPELAADADLAARRLVPITIEGSGAPERDELAPGETIVFRPAKDGRSIRVRHCPRAISMQATERIQRELAAFLASVAERPDAPLSEHALLAPEERCRVVEEWNATALELAPEQRIAALFGMQAERTPDATALVFEDRSLTYRELDERANQLAQHLRGLGVIRETIVGVHVERSLELVIAVLGVLKAGGAYLPLDPAFPRDRLAFMVEDADVRFVITERALAVELDARGAKLVRIDSDSEAIAKHPSTQPESDALSSDLAYVIYTSGSTGKPKGVMVEQKNVANFFAAMDQKIAREEHGDTWLAVTSLSFDISVLELLWTLTRGFKVVVYLDRDRVGSSQGAAREAAVARDMDFSLFYFSADAGEDPANKYRLLLEGARWADEHGFAAVWTPERHFHDFGGLYPNPMITSAAVAAITKRVGIRAGSVVVPLHHPVRLAEGWSIVDNLSNGRVGISIASGWQPDDFLLAPHNFKHAKEVMFKDIATIQKLWRGESVRFTNPTGKEVEVRTLPRPIQRELPVWVTTAGNVETYVMAGRIGANVLTHLLGQSVQELAPKIQAYKKARADAGFDPEAGVVSLMLHTFVSTDEDHVHDVVRGPMRSYLATSLSLLKHYAWAFPAFSRPKNLGSSEQEKGDELASLTPEEHEAMLDHAFERYYEESGLFGTPESCVALVDRLKAIGVSEIACLIDFGVPSQTVLDNLPHLKALQEASNRRLPAQSHDELAETQGDAAETHPAHALPRDDAPTADHSFAAEVARHGVTHMQCTPSMAKMLALHDESRRALATIRHLMVGGEALAPSLARELASLSKGTVTNMYGPTETTVWSTTHRLGDEHGAIPIGRPIANTRVYVLDPQGHPVPPLVAGELHIGGAGVVRGYLNRPELTGERFVADPFDGAPDARMYKTGDLARWREDGTLEFLGRNDHQVKIRGYRIELGEIESAIARHPSVREVVVVARDGDQGDARLVAYAVANGAAPDASALREKLFASLPEYMVPAFFVWLDRLPLTPNGKIDRKALPAPGGDAPSETVYVAPSSELEEVIAKVWRETLGREQVGVDDNFFDIGGHSLLVVRMHRRLDKVVEKPVSLTDLYRFTTIRALSKYLSSDGDDESMKESAARGARRRESRERRRKNPSTT